MMKKHDLPKIIPVFPLSNFIIFPNTTVPLNIFELRYIEMIKDSMKTNKLIGLIQPKQNKPNIIPDLYEIGCLGKITNFTETPDGKYQINLEGISRFKFKKIIKTDYKFITIDADTLIYKKNQKNLNKNLNENLLSYFKKFLDVKNIKFNLSEFEQLDSINLAKIICVISPLDNLMKQMLLEFNSEDELCSNLLSVLEVEISNKENNLKIN